MLLIMGNHHAMLTAETWPGKYMAEAIITLCLQQRPGLVNTWLRQLAMLTAETWPGKYMAEATRYAYSRDLAW